MTKLARLDSAHQRATTHRAPDPTIFSQAEQQITTDRTQSSGDPLTTCLLDSLRTGGFVHTRIRRAATSAGPIAPIRSPRQDFQTPRALTTWLPYAFFSPSS